MIKKNIRHELRILSRDHWFVALSLILILLCLYAGHNGQKLYEFKNSELEQTKAAQDSLIDLAKDVAIAMDNGEDPKEYYRISPMYLSIATGTLAYMPMNQLSALAIGQSDLYTHQLEINSRSDTATLTFNEMSNPVQLLFGNFDLVFVLTYLIPLIIIAFTYNLHSQERESGRLKLLASNPVNTKMWLFQRYLIRFLVLSVILSVAVVITITLNGISFSTEMMMMSLITFAYMGFWFSTSFAVNVFGKSSDKNAVVLLSTWIILVLLIPSIVNQTANSIYPTPSRMILLNEVRQTKAELSKELDKVIDEYLRNHPELAREEENEFAYWQGYFASHEMTEKELSPLLELFDSQLNEQQQWVKAWGFLSPAILFKSSFTSLAGTSSANYVGFKASVVEFAREWRDYFMPMVFENRNLTPDEVKNLPDYSFKSTLDLNKVRINMAVLSFSFLLLIGIGFTRKQNDIT